MWLFYIECFNQTLQWAIDRDMEQVNIEGEKDHSEHRRMISMTVDSDSVSLSRPNWNNNKDTGQGYWHSKNLE
jgi:hypothetical protein